MRRSAQRRSLCSAGISPIPNDENEEFYLTGCADRILDPGIRTMLIEQTRITMEKNEVIFELLLDRVMHTKLVDQGAPGERPLHRKWRDSSIELKV